MDVVGGAIAAIGVTVAIIAIAFAWVLARSAWYWTAAKIMGWSDQEKFERETKWIERDALREQLQRQKDTAVDEPDRRRIGAFLIAFVVGALSWRMNLQWWEIAGATALTYIGAHMVAGVAIKWWR